MMKKGIVVLIVLVLLPFVAYGQEVDLEQAREYVRKTFRIVSVSNKVLDLVLGEEFQGIPYLKVIGWLIQADQIYTSFAREEYADGIYLAYRKGADKAFVEVMDLAGMPGVALVARLAFSPIERALLKFQSNAVEKAIQNQTKLYVRARDLGCSHLDILRQENLPENVLMTKDGWLYIVGDLKIPPYGPARPGGNSREKIFGLAYDVYKTIKAYTQYEQDKQQIREGFAQRVLGLQDKRVGADIALVMDRSGSMTFPITDLDDTPRIEVAKLAAQEFADFVWPEDYLGIIHFAGDVKIPAQGNFTESQEIQEVIRGIEVGEWNGTAIGLALKVCYDGFETEDLFHTNQFIVLLTDGCNNLDPDPFEVIPKDGAPIFAIGLGSGEEFNEPALQRMAQITDGMYKHVDFESLEELGDFYGFIGTLMHGASTVLKHRGFINQDQKIVRKFVLGDGIDKAYINLNWGGSSLGASITSPNGAIVLPTRKGEVYLGFDLAYPLPGEHQIEIKGEEVDRGGEPYILSVAAVSPVIAYFHPFEPCYALGEKIPIRLEVCDQKRKPIPSEIILGVKSPQGEWELEAPSTDWDYEPPLVPGPYLIQARIDFVWEGKPYHYVLEETVWVGSREALAINLDSLEPKPGSQVDALKPKISAQILGPSHNIDLGAIHLVVNSREVDFDFDKANQQISWQSQRILRPGRYSVELKISGRQGQVVPPARWSFQINRPTKSLEPGVVAEEPEPQDYGQKEKEIKRDWSYLQGLQAINFPNPFSSATNFGVWLQEAGEIQIRIFNQKGQEIDFLVRFGKPGFNVVTWQVQNRSSGCYFYVVKSKNFVITRKMVITK